MAVVSWSSAGFGATFGTAGGILDALGWKGLWGWRLIFRKVLDKRGSRAIVYIVYNDDQRLYG